MKTPKQQMIDKVEEFILQELNHISTPMEYMIEKQLADEGISNDISKDRLERAGVLYNLYKILENYDALEPTLKKYFNERGNKDANKVEKGTSFIQEPEL